MRRAAWVLAACLGLGGCARSVVLGVSFRVELGLRRGVTVPRPSAAAPGAIGSGIDAWAAATRAALLEAAERDPGASDLLLEALGLLEALVSRVQSALSGLPGGAPR